MSLHRRLALPAGLLLAAAPTAVASPGWPILDTSRDVLGTPAIFVDTQGDAPFSPDLREMGVVTTDTGEIAVVIELGSSDLAAADTVITYIDVDGDGDPAASRRDVAVWIDGTDFGTKIIGGGHWNGQVYAGEELPSLSGRTIDATTILWRASMAELGITPGTTIGLMFGGLRAAAYGEQADVAPEGASAPFTFDVPPPPVVITSVPLRVSGLGLRRSGRTLRFRASWSGGTSGTRTVWGLRLRQGRATRTLRGVAAPGAPVVRRITLPAAWTGRPVQVRVTFTSGDRRFTATRTVRG